MDNDTKKPVNNTEQNTGYNNKPKIKYPAGRHPNSIKNLKLWKPGENPNPANIHHTGPQLAAIARRFLSKINPTTGRRRAEEFVEKVVTMAYEGDPVALKLVWNYVEGMPKITAEVVNKTEIDTSLEFLKNLIEEQRKNNNNELPIIPLVQDK